MHLGLVSPLVPLPGRPRPYRRNPLRLTAHGALIPERLPPLSRITVPPPVARECQSHPHPFSNRCKIGNFAQLPFDNFLSPRISFFLAFFT
jgi:hypothetical protein